MEGGADRRDLLSGRCVRQEPEFVAVRRLDQLGDRPRRGFADRHRVTEVSVGVHRSRNDDPSNGPLASTPTFGTPGADLRDVALGEANVGRSRPLDVQNGTYDEHAVFAGKLPAT
jgi:hypothetical protein